MDGFVIWKLLVTDGKITCEKQVCKCQATICGLKKAKWIGKACWYSQSIAVKVPFKQPQIVQWAIKPSFRNDTITRKYNNLSPSHWNLIHQIDKTGLLFSTNDRYLGLSSRTTTMAERASFGSEQLIIRLIIRERVAKLFLYPRKG